MEEDIEDDGILLGTIAFRYPLSYNKVLRMCLPGFSLIHDSVACISKVYLKGRGGALN